MKEKIKNFLILINRWKIILIIILVGAGLFYFYQIRPAQIYSKCHKTAVEEAIKIMKSKSEITSTYKEMAEKEMYFKDDYDYTYKQCLRERGINK